MKRHRILDPLWRVLVAGHRGMDNRVQRMLWRNLGIMILLSAAWPVARFWPVIGYAVTVTAMTGHRAVRYVVTWTFRRHVHEPVATVLDNIIRVRTPSKRGLVHVDIPRSFRDDPDTEIVVHVPMDWPATKEDMTAVARALEQRLATDALSARWTLTGRKPHGVFTLPSKPPARVDMADMIAIADNCADTAVAMGSGTRGQTVTFDLAMESPHLMLAAASGAGKSELLAWIVGQFMRRGYGVLCLDAKFVSHMWLRRVPGVLYAAESEELHEALLWLDGELLRRARFVSSGGDPDALVPLVTVLEEMNSAANRLRAYWKHECEGKGMSPALTALANLASMGREMRVHILLAGQSITARSSGGPEGRESFGGRALARATANQWRMLAPQIRPIPKTAPTPGRWHLVAGDTLKEFQAPFCDIKAQPGRLIEWATGGLPVPDVPAMMWGGGGGEILEKPSSGLPPSLIALRDYAQLHPEVELATLVRWRERRSDFPAPAGTGERGAKLYTEEDLDSFLAARVA